jgi:hypothetical protein
MPNTLVNSKKLTDFFKEKNLNPVYIYETLELDSTQKKIKSETLNLSGIYLILNKITLDYYIVLAMLAGFSCVLLT